LLDVAGRLQNWQIYLSFAFPGLNETMKNFRLVAFLLPGPLIPPLLCQRTRAT